MLLFIMLLLSLLLWVGSLLDHGYIPSVDPSCRGWGLLWLIGPAVHMLGCSSTGLEGGQGAWGQRGGRCHTCQAMLGVVGLLGG